MNRFAAHILAAAIILACAIPAYAQDVVPETDPGEFETAFRIGLFGGYGINEHDTRANVFTGGAECGAFSSGTGNGIVGGLVGEFPLVGHWLELTVGALYAQRGGAFNEAVTAGLPILAPDDDEYTELTRRHDYSANLGYMLGEFGVKLRPLESIGAFARIHASLGIPFQPTYVQDETILSPNNVLYPETNERSREVSSGGIDGAELMTALSGALGYDIPLGDRFTFAPEVGYHYTFGDVTPHYRWRVNTVTAGAALKFAFGSYPNQPEPEPDPEPVVVESPPRERPKPTPPMVSISASPKGTLKIVETVVTETFPLLPYIFFDSASAEIPARYDQITPKNAFRESALPHQSLDAYYSMLNIIGSRMSDDPETKITLNGTTDGREIASGASNLARDRADAVKKYLTDQWNIDPERIAVTTSPLPAYPSSMVYNEGLEENRRVEIRSSNDRLLLPLVFERFNEYSFAPEGIDFETAPGNDQPITGWELSITAGGRNVHTSSGSMTPPKRRTWTFDENVIAAIAKNLAPSDSLRAVLTVRGDQGATSVSQMAIPVTVEQNPFEVSRLSLVVFDFDRSDINEQNRRMISSFVSSSIHANSTASITGSTDRLGEAAHNMELSQARAVAVRRMIETEHSDAEITETRGIGASKLNYDNALPEGRFYCRTVTVEVKTPVTGQLGRAEG